MKCHSTSPLVHHTGWEAEFRKRSIAQGQKQGGLSPDKEVRLGQGSVWEASHPSFSQPWERGPSQLLLLQTVRRGVSQPLAGGAGFKLACSPCPQSNAHTQMGWELLFWNAKAPDSALGILAECVLGNVKATGNRGVPAHTIQQVGGEQKEQGVRGNWGPGLKGLSVRGFMYTEELRVPKGGSW